jgi:hypothetical protein
VVCFLIALEASLRGDLRRVEEQRLSRATTSADFGARPARRDHPFQRQIADSGTAPVAVGAVSIQVAPMGTSNDLADPQQLVQAQAPRARLVR